MKSIKGERAKRRKGEGAKGRKGDKRSEFGMMFFCSVFCVWRF